MLQIGSLVDGKYKILNKIGQGGMSVVYLAMNERANKQWAIKEVRKDGVSDFEVIKQGLVAEVDLLKKLNHPHLPSIVDVIDRDESFLIVMDYIEGVSLDKKMRELGGVVPQDNVIEWGMQLCDVLGYLHSREKPIIYRDMKPANVMLKPDGNVMLIDFGTAREFKSGNVADTTCLGTRGYAAPEQFGGRGQTDARTDIYCLGATMYHLVTGHNPCDYPYEMYPIRHWNPALSSGFEEIILKCTQKNPDDRFQSCAELLYALEHYRDMDIETKKNNDIKWRVFVALLAVALVLFASAGVSKVLSIRNNTYYFNDALTNANSATDFETLYEAAKLKPSDIAPYKKVVEIIEKDNIFTTAENAALLNTFLNPDSEVYKKISTTVGYNKFCYELGIAYMFYYETENVGLEKSQKWLAIAVDSTPSEDDYALSQTDINNAKVLYTLTKALCNKSKISGAAQIEVGGENAVNGSVEYSYGDYFNDLISALDFDVFEGVNTVTKRKVYSWIYSTLISDYDKLKRGGLSKERMTNVKQRAITDLESILASVSDSTMTSYKETKELLENFKTLGSSWN